MLKSISYKLLIFYLTFFFIPFSFFSQNLTSVPNFGTNPGELNMKLYVSSGISFNAPLVIALHGCTQTATEFSSQSGWNKLANLHKFYVVYPEQILANNNNKCFNWFDSTETNKDQGEALSIKQMVDYMLTNYSIDSSSIFVTGLSAGAGMTAVMLADYPELFNKGAIMAGLPYKAATSSFYAYAAMNGGITKTPLEWGNLVRNQNQNYTGRFPQLAIFHGNLDFTVNSANAIELIKQWTNLNNADQIADSTNNSFDGNSIIQKTIYNDNLNSPVVCYYKVLGMGHGISLDTGACPKQGGVIATYAIEKNFHSTYWAANFFKLLTSPYQISGAIQVSAMATNMVYSVPLTIGSIYFWKTPSDAFILSGQGTNSITVNFGLISDFIEVTETTSNNCIEESSKLFIDIENTTNINLHLIKSPSLFYDKDENCITININGWNDFYSTEIYDILGHSIVQDFYLLDNKINLYSELKAGIYFIKLIGNKKIYVCKLLIIKK